MFSLVPWRKGRAGSLAPRGEHPLSRLHDEFDALFNRFFGGLASPETFGELSTWWGLDLDDTGKEVVVRAEAPGFEAEDFDVEISNGVLTIKAEHRQGEQDKEDGNFSRRQFPRPVMLPACQARERPPAGRVRRQRCRRLLRLGRARYLPPSSSTPDDSDTRSLVE
jgi:HSP20 family protein